VVVDRYGNGALFLYTVCLRTCALLGIMIVGVVDPSKYFARFNVEEDKHGVF
jgi:hypothetical protein